MKRFVFAVLMTFAMMAMPAHAQKVPDGYQAAEDLFDSVSQDMRIEIQILMTASGYWPVYPSDKFSPNFFEAIKAVQTKHGLPADGKISEALLDRLLASSKPNLLHWGFAEARLPGRPISIWLPAGMGLKPEFSPDRIKLADPQGQIEIYINALPKNSLKSAYDAALADLKAAKINIGFARRKPTFAAIGYADGNMAGHWQYHTDKRGVIGLHVKWNRHNSILAADRLIPIVVGSFVAALDRTTFPEPFSLEASGQSSGGRASKGSASGQKPSASQDDKSQSMSSGTGFFVNAAGYMLTNAHVVEKCRNFSVTPSGGDAVAAKLVAIDTANDLALLRANTRPSATAAIRASIKLGEPVAVFGYPLTSVLSRNGNFTLGHITALAGMGDDSNQLQISAPVQPGNSGGPLIDQYGNLVGVIRAKLNAVKVAEVVGDVPQNVNFAIKATVAINFLSSNGVSFTEGQPATAVLDTVALADKAKSFSAFILCK